MDGTQSPQARLHLQESRESTQSQRRMLSPAFKRIPWTSDFMQVLERLDPNQRNGEIITNILSYEQRYLLNGGLSQKSKEMQDLLGIQFQSVGSGYKFISKPTPTWNLLQASKVCNLICSYKLAEIVSIVNNSVTFGIEQFETALHPGPSEPPQRLPTEAVDLVKKISFWPKLLDVLNDPSFVSQPSDTFSSSLTSKPASLQLLHALSDAQSRKNSAKIQHNILLAAAHIAYIKEHRVNPDQVSDAVLPDLPDLSSPSFAEQLQANLGINAANYVSKLCKPTIKFNPNSAIRFALHAALLVSPLCLLLPQSIEKKTFNRIALMQLSVDLGAHKPDILRHAENAIWSSIFDIVDRPCDYMAILKDLSAKFPPRYIEELGRQPGAVTAWFDIESRRTLPLGFSGAQWSTH
ncbi:hypothetical protein GALMADRAFT_256533 [Galerina marginata CBS 339.88]|uniref:Uncharacterized protein n=1 Tax=Galerina marginata (strain CBS 339.88) TaxID=685588 RepID=A0A067SFB7_GALM3|nr:hypothetical protein GALMADRAFT_256533 [Galerina marginata CBS 339.88]